MKNLLLPLQVIKHIPNDDLQEIYLKSRVLSFIVWTFVFSILSFVLVQFAGVDKATSIFIAIGIAIVYFLLRIFLCTEEEGKLLSEEVQAKLRKVDSIKKLEEEIEGKEELLRIQQVWLDESSKKNADLEKHLASLSAKNTHQKDKLDELETDIVNLDKQLKLLLANKAQSKIDAYELGKKHVTEIAGLKRSEAQKPSEEKLKEIQTRYSEIEKEREEALKG